MEFPRKDQGSVVEGEKALKPKLKRLNAYEQTLVEIKNRMLNMCDLVFHRVEVGFEAFTEQDRQVANELLSADDEIDTMDEELEIDALELISLQQPIAKDLRFLVAAMRISRELERIGDYACDIAEAGGEFDPISSFFQPLRDLMRMQELVLQMMRKSFKAYAEENVVIAKELDDDDHEIDVIFRLLRDKLMKFMKLSPDYVEQASMILLVARYLERIGDHVVNLAELTIFTETGMRHPFKIRIKRQED